MAVINLTLSTGTTPKVSAKRGDALVISSPNMEVRHNSFAIGTVSSKDKTCMIVSSGSGLYTTESGNFILEVAGQLTNVEDAHKVLGITTRSDIGYIEIREGIPGGGIGDGYTKDEVDNKFKLPPKVGILSPPNDFKWKNIPVILKKDSLGSFSMVTDISGFVLPIGKTYFVDVNNGINTNNGLTQATAFKSLSKALEKADAGTILIAPGVYDKDQGWAISDANFTTPSLIIKPMYKGDVILGANSSVTWADEGTPKVFKAARSNALNIYDRVNTDAFGDHTELTKVASISEVSNTPGSWFTDNISIYVRLLDDRTPNNNTVMVYTSSPNGFMKGNKTIYVEGIKFYGGTIPFEVSSKSTSDNLTAYFKDCEFKYGSDINNSNGLSVKGARQVILQNCTASRNPRDGFNYHEYNTINANVIEVDCMGYNNGKGHVENNNNGSTMHELGNIIRVNGMYFNNKGPNVVDVGGSQSWILGSTAFKSVSSNNSGNVNFQNQDGKTWLDSSVSYDSHTDISEAGTGKIYARMSRKGDELFETPEY